LEDAQDAMVFLRAVEEQDVNICFATPGTYANLDKRP
jgi:hypothetical protein